MESRRAASATRRWLRPVLAAGVVVALVGSARLLGLGEQLASARSWIEGLGAWGPLAFVGLYVAATVLALPAAPLTLAAGALFGTTFGIVLVSTGSTIGAVLAFLLARRLGREFFSRKAGSSEILSRLDRMTETHGAWVVALVRLVPVFPFNLVNYAFGLTRVRLGTYVLWSWLCMLPATAVYVAGADVAARAAGDGTIPWGTLVAALGALAVVVVLGYRARRRLAFEPGPEHGATRERGAG